MRYEGEEEDARDALRFCVGDIVALKANSGDVIFRLITETRPTGYTWEYLDRGLWEAKDDDYISENSNDPHLVWGWMLVARGATRPG